MKAMKSNTHCAKFCWITVFCLLTPVFCSHAQCTFSSGSTGADGAFTPTNSMPGTGWSISNNVVTVTNKPDGIFNFTSVYIETNWVVKFTKNALNTPVFLLATTNVLIRGSMNLDGQAGNPSVTGGLGGPGGFDGGTAPSGGHPNGSGFGPGGGSAAGGGQANGNFGTAVSSGSPYGTIDIRPFIGGSGGSGRDCCLNSGSGGGGALLIASSTLIDVSGTITASGGVAGGGPIGSGGAIKLVAQTFQGEGAIMAKAQGAAGTGRIRIETCVNKRISLSDPPATFGPPSGVFLTTNPTIRVTSIAGTNTPAIPGGSLNVPDVYLPTNNPAAISVSASNVNPGTTFKVVITPVYGTNMLASNTLSGTYAFSTGVVSIAIYTDRVWRVNALIDYIPRP